MCEECGEPFPVVELDPPDELDAELVELTKRRWRAAYRRIEAKAKEKGWERDWVDRVAERWLGPEPI